MLELFFEGYFTKATLIREQLMFLRPVREVNDSKNLRIQSLEGQVKLLEGIKQKDEFIRLQIELELLRAIEKNDT